MTEASFIGLLEATVSFGALLYLAALGEMITEKAGILNLGVEGMMAIGAVTGFVVALQTGNPWVALVAAIAAGALIGLLHGLFTVVLGAEQVVSGLSLTILGIGLAAYIGKGSVGQPAGAELVPVDWGLAVGHPVGRPGAVPAVTAGLHGRAGRPCCLVRAGTGPVWAWPSGLPGSRRRPPMPPGTRWSGCGWGPSPPEGPWPAPPVPT